MLSFSLSGRFVAVPIFGGAEIALGHVFVGWYWHVTGRQITQVTHAKERLTVFSTGH
jgi:hypothetical protein